MDGAHLDTPELITTCDLDAEGLVLSYCFEHGPLAGLEPKHFYADANRYVYTALRDLHSRAEPTDPVAVARELTVMQRLDSVGGRGYLLTLCNAQPATAYVEKHAEAVRELYRRRVLAEACERLRVQLRAGTTTAGEAWQEFKAICEGITES